MGTYYKVACDALQENIDPGDVNDGGIKLKAISHPQHAFGPLVVFAMAGRWNGRLCRVVPDNREDAAAAYDDYKDVTEEVITEYNRFHCLSGSAVLRYTKDPR